VTQSASRDSAVSRCARRSSSLGVPCVALALRSVGRFCTRSRTSRSTTRACARTYGSQQASEISTRMDGCARRTTSWAPRSSIATFCRTLDQSEMKASGASNGQHGLLRALLRPDERTLAHAKTPANCPACRTQRDPEGRYLEALLASAAVDETTRQAVERSHGLCERHFGRAVARGGPGPTLWPCERGTCSRYCSASSTR
jgi:hypothetical protein